MNDLKTLRKPKKKVLTKEEIESAILNDDVGMILDPIIPYIDEMMEVFEGKKISECFLLRDISLLKEDPQTHVLVVDEFSTTNLSSEILAEANSNWPIRIIVGFADRGPYYNKQNRYLFITILKNQIDSHPDPDSLYDYLKYEVKEGLALWVLSLKKKREGIETMRRGSRAKARRKTKGHFT